MITEAEDGIILRSFLKERLRISTRLLTALKRKEDGILLNGDRVTVRAVLHGGDRLTLSVEDEAEAANPHLTPVPLSVPILYEDEDVVVCNKPSGMPTHPSHGHREDTLANALAFLYQGRPFVFRAIGRLDRETGGALAVAKNPHSGALLSCAMQEGRIKKEYVAWV
ncbi:MAG: RluA family pseudouridine synthase, partial [Clostridia bacterium]|nr:RluA family pseudouridine synthase [Clostridia bacterium]